MSIHDDLGNRMKQYEKVPKIKLMRRTPVAIRIDGKAFHTFTRGFMKPFDPVMVEAMQKTTLDLCKHIQGCVFGYTQSDEITLILIDYQTFETDAWFDNEVQKICSISASMATMYFNKWFSYYTEKKSISASVNYEVARDEGDEDGIEKADAMEDQVIIYKKALEKGAMFDARCFNISKEEACNLVYWRQLDAIRNSTLSIGMNLYGHKAIENMTCREIREKLAGDNLPFEDVPVFLQRGSAIIKNKESVWIIDYNMPILKGENRKYLNDRILYEED